MSNQRTNFGIGRVHHFGIAVDNIIQSLLYYQKLGWAQESEIIEDTERDILIAFMQDRVKGISIELVSPLNDNSPVSSTLKKMKNVAMPYHICYEVDDIDNAIQNLKKERFVQTTNVKHAVALDNRNVVFLLNKNVGLIELLESYARN